MASRLAPGNYDQLHHFISSGVRAAYEGIHALFRGLSHVEEIRLVCLDWVARDPRLSQISKRKTRTFCAMSQRVGVRLGSRSRQVAGSLPESNPRGVQPPFPRPRSLWRPRRSARAQKTDPLDHRDAKPARTASPSLSNGPCLDQLIPDPDLRSTHGLPGVRQRFSRIA